MVEEEERNSQLLTFELPFSTVAVDYCNSMLGGVIRLRTHYSLDLRGCLPASSTNPPINVLPDVGFQLGFVYHMWLMGANSHLELLPVTDL
jgi:hypothetical protein